MSGGERARGRSLHRKQTGVYWAGGVGPTRPLDSLGRPRYFLVAMRPGYRAGIGEAGLADAVPRRGGEAPGPASGEPPVGLTEQLQDRGDQDHANQSDVDEDGDGQAEAEHVGDAYRVADDEGPQDADHGGGPPR